METTEKDLNVKIVTGRVAIVQLKVGKILSRINGLLALKKTARDGIKKIKDAVAASDNWKPTSIQIRGSMRTKMSKERKKTYGVLALIPINLPIITTPIIMVARNIEAERPDIKQKARIAIKAIIERIFP
jgi:hypothetical protein